MIIKVLAFAFLALMFNGWYTDIRFKNAAGEGDYISTEMVELDTRTNEGRKVVIYSDGAMYKESTSQYRYGVAKLSGQGDVKGVIYYSTSCYRVSYKLDTRRRCDTVKEDKESFYRLWNKRPLEVVYAGGK